MAQDESPAVVPPPAPAATQVIIQQPPTMFGRFGKWLLAALAVAVLVILGLFAQYQRYFSPPDRPQERFHSLSRIAAKKVAIIDVSGAILDGEGFAKRQIDRVREDDSVVAVVLRVNSPGGTITGSDYLYHHLRELRADRELPIVVSMGSLCASGGYYVSMAVGEADDVIFAEPTTWTGSIGVVIPRFDLTGAMRTFNVRDDSITSGPYKQMGSPTRPLTDDERQLLQTLVDDSFERFKEVVVSGRPHFKDDAAALDAVATGQIFSASQAIEHRLIDRIGFIEDAIERVAELAGYSSDELRCVRYERPPTLMGALLGVDATAPSGHVDLAALLELNTPRGYYIWSWLPAVLSSAER